MSWLRGTRASSNLHKIPARCGQLLCVMKMRRHRVFLLCTVGLCVISFLHYYKALHYVSLLRELSAPYPNIKSFIMVTGFFWREKGMATTPLSPASPEEAPPLPGLRQSDAKARGVPGLGGGGEGFGPGIPEAIAGGGDEEMRQREEPAPPHPWEKPKENQLGDAANEIRAEDRLKPWNPAHPAQPERLDLPQKPARIEHQFSDPIESMGDLHTRTFQLQDDKTPYFVRTKAGALCFRQGTEVATPKEYSGKSGGSAANGAVGRAVAAGQRKPLELQQQPTIVPKVKARSKGNGKRLVKCVCRPGWHGPYCGVPTMVYHSNLPTKERLTPRETPRRVINAINVNHEFDLLHARFHELSVSCGSF